MASSRIDISHIPENRRREWVNVIYLAFSFLLRDVPSGDKMKMIIRAFDEICKDIPTSLLVETAKCSMANDKDYWDGRVMLKTFLESAYLREKNAGLLSATTESTRKECQICNGSGFKTIYKGRDKGVVRCNHIEG